MIVDKATGQAILRRYISIRVAFINNSFMVCESPDIVAKRTKFILNIFKSRSIIDDSFNFRARLEHTLGLQDSLYVAFTITSNRINIKMIKAASDNVSFIQNRKPAEATLETFKTEMFTRKSPSHTSMCPHEDIIHESHYETHHEMTAYVERD